MKHGGEVRANFHEHLFGRLVPLGQCSPDRFTRFPVVYWAANQLYSELCLCCGTLHSSMPCSCSLAQGLQINDARTLADADASMPSQAKHRHFDMCRVARSWQQATCLWAALSGSQPHQVFSLTKPVRAVPELNECRDGQFVGNCSCQSNHVRAKARYDEPDAELTAPTETVF